MNSSHHACLDTKGAVQHHGDGCEAVGLGLSVLTSTHEEASPSWWVVDRPTHSAAGITNHIHVPPVNTMIHAIDHIQAILARRRDQHLFSSSSLDMHFGLFVRRHLACALHDVLCTRRCPVDLGSIPLREEVDDLALVQQGRRDGVVGGSREEIGVIRWSNG